MSEQIGSDENAVDEASPASLPGVGEQLSAARQARGLDIVDIAQTLKLGPRQVEALENGDWQLLPGQTFIRGFVRNYARMVQIDPAPLMAQLDAVLDKPANTLAVPETRPAAMPMTAGSVSRRDRTVMLVGVGLVLLAALVYFLLPNDLSVWRENAQGMLDSLARKEEPATPPAAPEATPADPVFPPGTTPQQVMNPQALSPAEAPLPVAPAAPVGAAPAGVQPPAPVASAPQLRFVVDKESWLEVRDRDNKLVFSQRLAAGTEQVLSGEGPLSLVVGYAPGVKLFWHGQPVDLAPHTRGDVARLVLE